MPELRAARKKSTLSRTLDTRRYFKISFTIFTLLCCILLLAGSVAAVISPSRFWPVAFAGLLFPVLVVINLALLVYWAFQRSVIALGLIASLLIASYHFPDYFGLKRYFSGNSNSVANNRIRVMTWNMHYFQSVYEDKKAGRKAMLKLIGKIQPDIFCIQEYYNWSNRKINLDDSIQNDLGTRYYFFKPLKQRYSGIAIFSKYPIIQTGYIPLSEKDNSNQCIFTDITKNGKRLRIFNVHLRSNYLPEKNSKKLKAYQGVAGKFRKCREIFSKLKTSFIRRSLQVDNLKVHLRSSPYPYILAGDFNDTPSSYTFHQLSDGLKNCFTEKGKGFGDTHWSDYPGVQIDYIMVSRVFNVKEYKITHKKISDHYPVYTDLEWR